MRQRQNEKTRLLSMEKRVGDRAERHELDHWGGWAIFGDTYIAVWEERDREIRLVEVTYAGTHEKAPY